MVTLDQVLARVAAADTTADRDRLRRTVLDTIAALGLHVHPPTGEVYDPAPKPLDPHRQVGPAYVRGRRTNLRR